MKRLISVGFALTLLVCVGCAPSKPQTQPVTGKVMFKKSQPAAGALIVFHPVHADFEKRIGGKPTCRKVSDDGTYTLSMFEDGDGAPEGDYGVTIQWEAKPKEGKLSLGSEGAPVGRSMINEAKYGNPQKPFTKVTVKKGEKNEFNFDVD